jgi:hypothetical protein
VAELVTRFYPKVPLRKPLEALENLVDNAAITRETGWEPKFRLHELRVAG